MFKTAERTNAHFAIIIGEEEMNNEVVNIKCLCSKTQDVVPLEKILEYIEHHVQGGHKHE